MTRRAVVVDHETSQPAKAVEDGRTAHPRVPLRLLPTDGPRTTPIERACGAVHDGCTRNHQRTRRPALVTDGADHLSLHGPWTDQLSALSDAPIVTAAVEQLAAEDHAKAAA